VVVGARSANAAQLGQSRLDVAGHLLPDPRKRSATPRSRSTEAGATLVPIALLTSCRGDVRADERRGWGDVRRAGAKRARSTIWPTKDRTAGRINFAPPGSSQRWTTFARSACARCFFSR
jgi:hypothetical protein